MYQQLHTMPNNLHFGLNYTCRLYTRIIKNGGKRMKNGNFSAALHHLLLHKHSIILHNYNRYRTAVTSNRSTSHQITARGSKLKSAPPLVRGNIRGSEKLELKICRTEHEAEPQRKGREGSSRNDSVAIYLVLLTVGSQPHANSPAGGQPVFGAVVGHSAGISQITGSRRILQ